MKMLMKTFWKYWINYFSLNKYWCNSLKKC
jgi:hypothetical protein